MISGHQGELCTRSDMNCPSTNLQGLGVGGSGHFAVWLDNDLFEGSSNPSNTFHSASLSSKPDFHVVQLELWHVA